MQICGQREITSIKLSDESHVYWKDHFHKNPLFFRNMADFEDDDEIDNFSMGSKTTNTFKQSPVLNGYYIIFELNDFLKSCPYRSPLKYINTDWFVDEVINLEKNGFLF